MIIKIYYIVQKINMKTIYIILLFIFNINCNYWFPEVNGYDPDESNNGFAGSNDVAIMDFYLCSERYYRVHYYLDDPDDWSKEFTACQPVGIGKQINGVTISGGLGYNGRAMEIGWLGEVTLYNISDYIYGYSGVNNRALNSIAIDGGEYYRTAYFQNLESSNEYIVAQRVIKNIFKEEKSFNYEKEIELYNGDVNISVILLNSNNINFEGKITIKVETSQIIFSNYNELISERLKIHLAKVLNFDYDKMNNIFEEKFYMDGIRNGTVTINFKWSENCIEIDSGIKILSDYHSYRGGFRIIIRLRDNEELLSKIKNILKALFKFFGKKIPTELLSDFNSFKEIEPILNELDINSIVAEQIILYTILYGYISF